jgi:Ribose 5-phosphate isomerase A (phosphoriboisomerase A)
MIGRARGFSTSLESADHARQTGSFSMTDKADRQEAGKRLAAEAAVAQVRDSMIVGLGTGSTAAYVIALPGRSVAGGLSIRGIPTSRSSERLAREAGIEVTEFGDPPRVDLTIDGIRPVTAKLTTMKMHPELRRSDGNRPFVTDTGNDLLDPSPAVRPVLAQPCLKLEQRFPPERQSLASWRAVRRGTDIADATGVSRRNAAIPQGFPTKFSV